MGVALEKGPPRPYSQEKNDNYKFPIEDVKIP